MKATQIVLLTGMLLMPFAVHASTSGYCGEKDGDGNWGTNCTWVYDTNTHTLTVSGTGKVAGGISYYTDDNGGAHYYNDAAWGEYAQDIKNAVINEGIINVGYGTFYMTALEHVSLPQSLKIIGAQSFQYNHLKELQLPENIDFIGHAAFHSTDIESIVIPENFGTNNSDNTHIFGTRNLSILTVDGNAYFDKDMLIGSDLSKINTIYCNVTNDNCQNLLDDADIGSKIAFYEKEDGLYKMKDENNNDVYFASAYLIEGGKKCENKEQCLSILGAISQNNPFVIDGKFYASINDFAKGNYVKKRIYTIGEANAVSGKKNTVKIRYK